MTGRTPRPSHENGDRLAVTPPKPADYSDELTDEQIAALKRVVTQNEKEMGPVVHEFTW
jgi:hypothetical protein